MATRALDVLVVERDSETGREMAEWLEADGCTVSVCPGPDAPDYTCVGGKTEYCPLAAGVDIVVLDLRLASDAARTGTPGWHLLTTYYAMGKRLIVLGDDGDFVRPTPEERVQVLPRPASREELTRAVARAQATLAEREA